MLRRRVMEIVTYAVNEHPNPRGPQPEQGSRLLGKSFSSWQTDQLGSDDVTEHDEQEFDCARHEMT